MPPPKPEYKACLVEVKTTIVYEASPHIRRGGRFDPAWAHRRLLLRAGDRLSPKALARLETVLATDDPTNEIGAAWGVKELLRPLLASNGPTRYSRHETAHRLTRFLDACADAGMVETDRLATTIDTWWPEIEAFLQPGVTNGPTEANLLIKRIKRVSGSVSATSTIGGCAGCYVAASTGTLPLPPRSEGG